MNSTLIVGLGNPGTAYERTRHNLGFLILDRMVELAELNFGPWQKESDAEVSSSTRNDEKVFCLKPLSFMNNSGSPVQRFVSFYKIPLERVLVVHDDLDLPFGELRQQHDRGAAGHNGVSDIIEKLGSQQFNRLRVGIGTNRDQGIPAEDYVLQRFSSDEEKKINEIIESSVLSIRTWLRFPQ